MFAVELDEDDNDWIMLMNNQRSNTKSTTYEENYDENYEKSTEYNGLLSNRPSPSDDVEQIVEGKLKLGSTTWITKEDDNENEGESEDGKEQSAAMLFRAWAAEVSDKAPIANASSKKFQDTQKLIETLTAKFKDTQDLLTRARQQTQGTTVLTATAT